eukprot:5605619-Ditylum_brightwellii.AAC.1
MIDSNDNFVPFQPCSTVDNDDTPAQLKLSSKPARKRCRMDWLSEDLFPYLKDAIIQKHLHSKLRRETLYEGKLGPLQVPKSTVRLSVKHIKAYLFHANLSRYKYCTLHLAPFLT